MEHKQFMRRMTWLERFKLTNCSLFVGCKNTACDGKDRGIDEPWYGSPFDAPLEVQIIQPRELRHTEVRTTKITWCISTRLGIKIFNG